jgi:hypothetical protein
MLGWFLFCQKVVAGGKRGDLGRTVSVHLTTGDFSFPAVFGKYSPVYPLPTTFWQKTNPAYHFYRIFIVI